MGKGEFLFLLRGLQWTLILSAAGFICGIVAGLGVALLRTSGIRVLERVEIPADLIPPDARVEMDAKKAAGYFTSYVPSELELTEQKGRGLNE